MWWLENREPSGHVERFARAVLIRFGYNVKYGMTSNEINSAAHFPLLPQRLKVKTGTREAQIKYQASHNPFVASS